MDPTQGPSAREEAAMTTKRKIAIVTGAAVLVAVATGTTAAIAKNAADDAEAPITGPALAQASAAALAATGGGRVTGTEIGDEESFYEVEITLDDGSQVDVQLDGNFAVVGREADGAGEDDGGSGSDD
jgi:uncharacterized membrane protein YkoI